MERYLIILAAAVLTYGARLGGFLLSSRRIPPVLDRFLTYVPVGVFAALITPELAPGTKALPARLIGVVAASLVVLRVRHLWTGLAVGMAAYWIARALGLN